MLNKQNGGAKNCEEKMREPRISGKVDARWPKNAWNKSPKKKVPTKSLGKGGRELLC